MQDHRHEISFRNPTVISSIGNPPTSSVRSNWTCYAFGLLMFDKSSGWQAEGRLILSDIGWNGKVIVFALNLRAWEMQLSSNVWPLTGVWQETACERRTFKPRTFPWLVFLSLLLSKSVALGIFVCRLFWNYVQNKFMFFGSTWKTGNNYWLNAFVVIGYLSVWTRL